MSDAPRGNGQKVNQALLDKARAGVREFTVDGVLRRWEIMESPQGPRVRMDGKDLIMLASNNYLNLMSWPEARRASIEAVEKYGVGMAAGRTLCGTNALHEELEAKLAALSGTDGALLYHSAYSANIGAISALAGAGDVILSDQFNHASLIDGCRMSRAETKVYPHADMKVLEALLREAGSAPIKLIVTDGVFSFDGDIAPLPDIVDLARRYSAVVVCDDAHSAGVLGRTGGGTPEYFGLEGEVDVITGTLGKALGGTVGGYVATQRDVIDYLITHSRSFIFTNALPPAAVAANIAVLDLLAANPAILTRLHANAKLLRGLLSEAGFELLGSGTPICPVLLRDSDLTVRFGRRLFDEGVFAPGFGYPIAPRGQARIRTIMNAELGEADIRYAGAAFAKVGRELGVVR